LKNFTRTYFNDEIDKVYSIVNDEKWSPLLNHGYKNLDSQPVFNYDEEDRKWSNQLNLYTHLFEVLKKFNLDFKKLNLLDIGCGFGKGAASLKKYYMFNEVIGLDYNLDLINHAKIKFKDVTYIHGSATDLPFEDKSIDIIVNIESLHHYKHTPYYYKEVYRVLKQGGYLLMSDIYGGDQYVSEIFFNKAGFHMSDKINIRPMVAESCKDEMKNFKSNHPYMDEKKVRLFTNLYENKYEGYINNIDDFFSYIYYKI